MFCNVRPDCVIENLTMPSLYECPLMLETAGSDQRSGPSSLHLQTPPHRPDRVERAYRAALRPAARPVTIALVGKYVKLHDAYLSVVESLYHAGFENESKVNIKWVDSEHLVRTRTAAPRNWATPTVSSCRAASATAALRA